MRPALTLFLALLIPMAALANDISPNTGDIKLNSNINMHVTVGGGAGCAPGYLWHYTYGGCRMRGPDIADSEFAQCPAGFTGTRARSRYREQWLLQGSGQVAWGPWSEWGGWDGSNCIKESQDPKTDPNRASLSAYSTPSGSGESDNAFEVYAQCTIYRNGSILIDRTQNVGMRYYHQDALAFNGVQSVCESALNEIRGWGINASIDYSTIDWSSRHGWARMNY